MFAGLINQAKSAVSGLVERYGHVLGYWLMAGGLAAIGVVAALVVSVKEHQQEVAEVKAEESDTAHVFTDATAQAIVQTPIALLGTLFTVPGGASAALRTARVLGRNFPLVLLLVMIGALFWPTDLRAETEEDIDVRKPNGSDHVPSSLRH